VVGAQWDRLNGSHSQGSILLTLPRVTSEFPSSGWRLQSVGWTEPPVSRDRSLGCCGSGVTLEHTPGTPARNPHEIGLAPLAASQKCAKVCRRGRSRRCCCDGGDLLGAKSRGPSEQCKGRDCDRHGSPQRSASHGLDQRAGEGARGVRADEDHVQAIHLRQIADFRELRRVP